MAVLRTPVRGEVQGRRRGRTMNDRPSPGSRRCGALGSHRLPRGRPITWHSGRFRTAATSSTRSPTDLPCHGSVPGRPRAGRPRQHPFGARANARPAREHGDADLRRTGYGAVLVLGASRLFHSRGRQRSPRKPGRLAAAGDRPLTLYTRSDIRASCPPKRSIKLGRDQKQLHEPDAADVRRCCPSTMGGAGIGCVGMGGWAALGWLHWDGRGCVGGWLHWDGRLWDGRRWDGLRRTGAPGDMRRVGTSGRHGSRHLGAKRRDDRALSSGKTTSLTSLGSATGLVGLARFRTSSHKREPAEPL